jgi:nitric oxide dioxygenase
MALKLSEAATEAIRASLPAVAAGGPAVTDHFYQKLFTKHPELKNTFNVGNQLGKRQQRALFHAIAAAASSAINENGGYGLPSHVVDIIAHKHCALLVARPQYDVVGANLIETIIDLLNPSKEVLDGWGELYGKVAGVMMDREDQLYNEVASKKGGWKGKRTFIVDKKHKETDHVTSFYFVPEDGGALPEYLPGQYTTLWLHPKEWEFGQPRHYTLSDASNGKYFRVSIKKQGLFSNYMHDHVQEGDKIELSPPFGQFTLDPQDDKGDVVLLSAGVGVTPMLSMLNALLQKDEGKQLSRQVNWFHAARGKEFHHFKEYIQGIAAGHPNLKTRVWYSKADPESVKGTDYDFEGVMDLEDHRKDVEKATAQYYFCGPPRWMTYIRKQLTSWGVPEERLHSEVFGPALAGEEPEQ